MVLPCTVDRAKSGALSPTMGGVAATNRAAAAMTRKGTIDDGKMRCTEFTSFSRLDFDSQEPRYRVARLRNVKCRGVGEIFPQLKNNSRNFFDRVESGPRNFPKPQA